MGMGRVSLRLRNYSLDNNILDQSLQDIFFLVCVYGGGGGGGVFEGLPPALPPHENIGNKCTRRGKEINFQY